MSKVLAFKLIGGDEVVAEVLDEKRHKSAVLIESKDPVDSPVAAYVVRRPHILRFQPVAPGQIGLAFVPWTLSNPEIERLEIPASAVVLSFEPSQNVERQYLEQTSGLAIAKTPPPGRISTPK